MEFIDVKDSDSCDEFNHHVKTKPTFVLFYSPQCGHCQSLEPKWDKMTEILEKDYKGDMMVSRVRNDLMENINCDKNIKGFPTMFVLEIGGKKIREHSGSRETVDLVKFVEDNFPIRKKEQRGGRRRKTRRRKTRRRKTRRRKKRRKTRRRKTRRNRDVAKRDVDEDLESDQIEDESDNYNRIII